ncbi:isoprenyl transferase [Sphingobacterium sp. lm-10]|uniref:isoprenyl transferase n=1 Tax=Sphingobacterium sp. lm-10 TaxID=2944904 RepID=UPI00201FEE8B|nr:isoprenyl transferase [Sphingobacterium sp. lm-10]MCL7987666.1 isoprenyl transferase [Sphingobacterium sp. lm-10]
MDFKDKINKDTLPQHIAIIMDGNGRWAREKGEDRVFGHQNGVNSVRETLEGCVEIGVPFVTLYAFSTENWNRPKEEVQALMEILVHSLSNEVETFKKNRVKLHAIGNIDDLPAHCQRTLQETINQTDDNAVCTLTLALSYGARAEIIQATKKIAQRAQAGEINITDINDKLFSESLYTTGLPDPDLMIRTSGEQRISNFMLWQLAYTELAFLPIMWPEFTREHLYECIYNYQNRERRFGKTSEQL